VFLAAHDDDPFARYEAMQDLVVRHLCGLLGGSLDTAGRDAGRQAIGSAFSAVLGDGKIDDLMRGELLILPGETYLAEQMLVADPAAIRAEREGLKAWLGKTLEGEFAALHERAAAVPGGTSAEAKGARKVKSQALVFLAAGDPERAAKLAAAQYGAADNMTDRQGALMVLTSLQTPERTAKLLDFYERFKGNALVIDKWFALQASSLHPNLLEQVKALAEHPDFTLKNPNRVRSLYMPFTGTAQGFHAASGEGYRMIADLILALDPLNPQTAARFVPPLGRWRRIEAGRAELMRQELERIATAPKLSRDTYEQVTRSLG
jgi:aminopeptidase N